MIAVKLTDKNSDTSKRTQVLSRQYVERFNSVKKVSGKEYSEDSKATKAYYATPEGKLQAKSEEQEAVNADDTKKIIKSPVQVKGKKQY